MIVTTTTYYDYSCAILRAIKAVYSLFSTLTSTALISLMQATARLPKVSEPFCWINTFTDSQNFNIGTLPHE